MKTSSASLPEQQQALRQRMHMQRALIAQLMQPIEPAPGDFPRSLTMRFFSEHPGLATRLLAQAATLVVGGRLLLRSSSTTARKGMTRGWRSRCAGQRQKSW